MYPNVISKGKHSCIHKTSSEHRHHGTANNLIMSWNNKLFVPVSGFHVYVGSFPSDDKNRNKYSLGCFFVVVIRLFFSSTVLSEYKSKWNQSETLLVPLVRANYLFRLKNTQRIFIFLQDDEITRNRFRSFWFAKIHNSILLRTVGPSVFIRFFIFHIGLLTVVYCASLENPVDLNSVDDYSNLLDDYDENTCPKRCNEQYSPICGEKANGDKQIFVNSCHMSMENCQKPSNEGFSFENVHLFVETVTFSQVSWFYGF